MGALRGSVAHGCTSSLLAPWSNLLFKQSLAVQMRLNVVAIGQCLKSLGDDTSLSLLAFNYALERRILKG